MMPLKRTKRKLIITAVVAFLVLVSYFIFFGIISSTNKALAELDFELSSEVRIESELKNLNDAIEGTVLEREILDSYFIATDGVVDFINDLENLVRRIGGVPEITLVNIRDTIVPGAVDSFEYLNVEIVIEGAWGELFNFAELVDTMPLFININKVSFENIPNKDEGGGPSSEWRGVFNIDVIKHK